MAHEIVRRGATPTGTKMQIEDWTGVFDFEGSMPFKLAAYAPITNLAALDRQSRYWFHDSVYMRVCFEFPTIGECTRAFEACESGAAKLADYVGHAGAQDRGKNYINAVDLN